MAILNDYVKYISNLSKNLITFIDSRKRQIDEVIKKCTGLSVKEVRPGGSYEKGTMLNYKLDVDIVFLINKNKGKQNNFDDLLTELFCKLKENCKNAYSIEKGNKIAIYLKFRYEKSIINFDIVLSFPLNSVNQIKDHVGERPYQGGTTIWQLDYLNIYKGKPYFIDIIILLKDWKTKNDIPFLKSFHIELLVAFVYGRYNFENNIEKIMNICFCSIQAMMDGKPIIPMNWKYCKSNEYKKHYNFPVMIDPSNPNDNLLSKITKKECMVIKRNVSKAITLFCQKKYKELFEPKIKDFFK